MKNDKPDDWLFFNAHFGSKNIGIESTYFCLEITRGVDEAEIKLEGMAIIICKEEITSGYL